ncbi:phage tail tape measure protein [Desulfosarcina sp. OttesenSCG-928-A07]|nr:phage tail tape measure protein [Desulfosarcina sp. OttesenSCG-928-G17]MDL2329091.1 phage tail tape measure protein [Desulfosarcina sp. OttesenSCG-928-A07]
MAKTAGFNFTIGARMASSVASVFNTVSARAKNLRGDVTTLNAMSRTSGALLKTQARVADLRAQATAGKDVKKSLMAAETALAAAQRQAKKYNITMEGAAKAHAQATAQIRRTEEALKRQQTLMRNSAKRRELQGEMMGTVASAGMVVAPVKIAIDFESSMADAAKTIDGMRDKAGNLTPEYYKMESAVKSLGRELPLTHTEIASLFAAGGQMGMTTAQQLSEFSTLAAHMSVAFGMGTDAAADAIGGYKTKLGLTNEQVREMLDLTNQFANTSSATEKDIAGIVSRVGALGDIAGIAYKPMTAMAATLASMKVPEEIAATGLKNFMLALSKGDAATKQQQDAFSKIGVDPKKLAVQMQKDAEGAMISVLEKIKTLQKHEQTAVLTRLFGTQSVGAIAPMLTQLDLLKDNFVLSGETAEYAGAMQKEFENRAKTTANNLIILKNKASEVAITMGSALLPGLNDVISAMGRGAVILAAFADANPAVAKAVMYAVTALAAFKVATLAGGYGMTLASDAMVYGRKVWTLATLAFRRSTYAMIAQKTVSLAVSAQTKALAIATGGLSAAQTAYTTVTNRSTYAMVAQKSVGLALASGTKIVTLAQWGLNAAMMANPIGLVIAAVAGLTAGMYWLYKNCEPVRTGIDAIWKVMKTVGQNVLRVMLLPSAIAWNGIKAVWGPAKEFFGGLWSGITGLASSAWSGITWFASLCWEEIKSNWSDVSSFFGGIWNGVKDTVTSVFPWISNFIGGIWDGIKAKAASVFDWIGKKIEWAASKVEWLTNGWETAKGWVSFGDDKKQKTKVAMEANPVAEAMTLPEIPPAKISKPANQNVISESSPAMATAMNRPTTQHISVPAFDKQVVVATMPKGAGGAINTASLVATMEPKRQQVSPVPTDPRESAPAVSDQRMKIDPVITTINAPAASPARTQTGQPANIRPSLNLTVNLHGISDQSFGDRVLDAVESKKSEFERFLEGLMKNASRVQYG